MKNDIRIRIQDILEREDKPCTYGQELLIVILNGKGKQIIGENFLLQDSVSFLFARKGNARIKVNEVECLLTENSIIDILDTDILHGLSLSPGFEGSHLILSIRFLEEIMRNTSKSPAIVLNRMENLCFKLSDQEAYNFQKNIDEIIFQLNRKELFHRRELIKTYCKIFLLEFLNIAFTRRKETTVERLNKEDLVVHFTHLLNENCCEQHEVRWYANELCIDATYLSRILKSFNGKTTNQWIDDALTRKAKLYLSDDNTPVKDIADKLNFSDQAAFGKFFRKQEGLSPANYRRAQLIKKLEKDQEEYLSNNYSGYTD